MVYTCICTIRGVILTQEKALEILKQDVDFLEEEKLTEEKFREAEEGGFLNEIVDEYLHGLFRDYLDERITNFPTRSLHIRKEVQIGQIVLHRQGCCAENAPWVIGAVLRRLVRSSGPWCAECEEYKKMHNHAALCEKCIGIMSNGEIYPVDQILQAPFPTTEVPTQWDEKVLKVVRERLHLEFPLRTVLMLDDCLSCT
jgi:hypothetical protein